MAVAIFSFLLNRSSWIFDPRWLAAPIAGILKPAVFGDEAIA
jgi:hypothetical protein